jgi:hypothetical protein
MPLPPRNNAEYCPVRDSCSFALHALLQNFAQPRFTSASRAMNALSHHLQQRSTSLGMTNPIGMLDDRNDIAMNQTVVLTMSNHFFLRNIAVNRIHLYRAQVRLCF